MTRRAKPPKQPKKRPATGIPFGNAVRAPGWERNARLELAYPNGDPDLKAQIKRYLADPLGETLKDAATRERLHVEFLDSETQKNQRRDAAGAGNLARRRSALKDSADVKAVTAFNAWCADQRRRTVVAPLNTKEKLRRYFSVAKTPDRVRRRLRALQKAGKL